MATVHTFYCQSTNNKFHAFCLLRSPFRKSIEKKIQELADGHGFLNWEIMKIDEKTEAEFIENNMDFDTLYVGEKKEESVN